MLRLETLHIQFLLIILLEPLSYTIVLFRILNLWVVQDENTV